MTIAIRYRSDMNQIQKKCAESYARHKKLKMVEAEIGIPWQTVYVHLRAAGVAVSGDKSRYGSFKDKLAAKAEAEFERLIPIAQNMNKEQFQAKIDFKVGHIGVDVKSSKPNRYDKNGNIRWAFSIKRHQMSADFLVCFGYDDPPDTYALFLIPGELVRDTQTISIPYRRNSKWVDYQIKPADLRPFFDSLLAN